MKNELAFTDEKSALEVARILLKEDYVVMLSLEEQLTILNFEWAPNADRNDMIFMSKENFEESYM